MALVQGIIDDRHSQVLRINSQYVSAIAGSTARLVVRVEWLAVREPTHGNLPNPGHVDLLSVFALISLSCIGAPAYPKQSC